MAYPIRLRLLQGAACASFLVLAACGDGGGVNSTPTPTPAPAPTPTPVPTPTPTPTPPPGGYDTSEYRATVGAVSADALAAYNAGATGLGIKVGIVDSGIDAGTTDFGNRISSASKDVASNRPLDDEGGHGTAVAFTIAGQRNGVGTHGIAFDATLIIARADTPGTCAQTDSDGNPDCTFNDNAIAAGVTLAANNGAKVINLSLGGSAPGSVLVSAINRATAKGVIIVISAGNDGTANPDPFAEVANQSQAHGLVIIAGSIGANNARTPGADHISDFSDRAGNSITHFLTAVGEDVRAPCDNTSVCLWSGTSFAAPQISGAVALLAQAFPNLTGAQIVDILFKSARDAGAVGPDPVYGEGVLDLTAAFQPMGTTSVAGTATRIALDTNATLSAPMGDASQAGLGAVILDGYDRAFAMDLAQTIARSGPARTFAGALQSRTQNISGGVNGTSIAVTIAPTSLGATVSPMRIGEQDAQVSRAIAGSVVQRLGEKASFAFGFATSGEALTARLAGRTDPAFLIASDPLSAAGFDSRIGSAAAYRMRLGGWGLTAAVESGDVLTRPLDVAMAGLGRRYQRFAYDRTAVSLDRRFGGLALGVTGTMLRERDTVLGAHFGDALGATNATSWFLDAVARYDAGGGWSFGGSMRHGWTLAATHGAIAGHGLIATDAFAADAEKQGVFGAGDSFGFRLAQPLRVSRGGIDLTLPTDYDYDTLAVSQWTTERLNLAPTGREIDAELRYALPFWAGMLQSNLFWRRDPGNFASLPNDVGAALRWSRDF